MPHRSLLSVYIGSVARSYVHDTYRRIVEGTIAQEPLLTFKVPLGQVVLGPF